MAEEYSELEIDQFLINYLPDKVVPPSKANYSRLPYHDLSPKRFEQLCLKYAYAVHGISRCSIYGNPGQDQHGLDILVSEIDGKFILYQCKHVQEFSSNDLIKALTKFNQGRWSASTSKFILFSSNELVETNFLNEFEDQRSVLERKGIVLEKMGSWETDEALKRHPGIVDEFFGIEWVEKFNSAPEKDQYLASKKVLPVKKRYPEVTDYIARKLHNPLKFKTYYGHESFILQTLLAWIKECHASGKPVRTLIRSNAGLGKSKEVENIAHHFSEDAECLYPVIVLLKNYNGDLDKLVGAFYEGWKEIPKNRLFLMFDGLDEVPNNHQNAFTKDFNLLLQEYQQSNIIASARSNYSTSWVGLGSEQAAGLNVQTLQQLSDSDIQEYLQQRIATITITLRFNALVKSNKLDELLYNPFYLKNLTDIFLENESAFPANRADAIKKIIQLKLKNDASKYSLVTEQSKAFGLLAKRLAVFLTMTGRNSVEREFIKELSDIPLDELRYCSLFKLEFVEESEVVFFEHNNFQEYLAATYFSELPWERLATAMFHEPGGVILKPRLINTANYLFTLLNTSGSVYQAFFEILKAHNQELFLNFEKDKIPFAVRLEIFKAIIETGKKEEIYYLRSDYDSRDLLEFIEFNQAGFEYIISQLNVPDIENVHRQCLIELLFFFKPEKIIGKNRRVLYELLKSNIVLNTNSATHDLVIDTVVIHGFHTPADIRMILSKCPNINEQMVRGAWLKMVKQARNAGFFKDVLQSSQVLFDNPHRVVAGLEYEFISYVKEQLSADNIKHWLSFMKEKIDLLANLLDNMLSPEKKALVDEIYAVMADIYLRTKNEKIYQQFIRVIYEMREYNNDSLWGNPALFFIKTGHRKKAFFDLLNDGDNLMFRFVINSTLADQEILDEVISRYNSGTMAERSVNIVSNLLSYHRKFDLFDHLKNGLPPAYFKQFDNSDLINWNEKIKEWQVMDLALLSDRNLFFAEAAKLYDYVVELKDFDEDMGWIELQYNEKAIVKKRVNNDIIFRTIERNKIAGGYKDFVKWFDDVEWDWFVFYNVYNYLMEKKISIPEHLLIFLQDYTLKQLVPKVNFRKAYRLNDQKRLVHITHAGTIRKLFMEKHIQLPDNILLDMLSFDAGGFTRIPPGENLEERMFMKIYHILSDKKIFKQRILENIQQGYINYDVLESHCTACVAFHYPEAIPDLAVYLTKKSVSDDIKWNIVKTISILDSNSEVFASQLENIKIIRKYWQFEIFKLVLQNNYLMELLPTTYDPEMLIEKSITSMVNDNRMKFDLIEMGIKIGSKKAADSFFSFLKGDVNWHKFSSIEFDDLQHIKGYTPIIIIDKCFELLPAVFAKREDRHNYLENFLRNLINHTAKTDYQVMVYALSSYEGFIAKYRKVYKSAIMLRWNEKELIKAYYLTASKFDDDGRVLEWVKDIAA